MYPIGFTRGPLNMIGSRSCRSLSLVQDSSSQSAMKLCRIFNKIPLNLRLVPDQGITSSNTRFSSTGTTPGDDKIETTNISVSLFKNPIVHQLWTARQAAKKKSLLRKSPVEKLLTGSKGKTPSEARVEVCYPFATDAMLWESYRNPWGQIRFGKMLEDLDALAGNIAFFHVDTDNGDETAAHPVIVTASVDKITLRERPKSGSNQRLSGQVTWTGRSSMEIRMKCIEGCNEEWLDAYVTFVTLDPVTKRPIQVPPVIPTTPEEKAEFEAGALRAAMRKERRKKNQSTTDDASGNEIQQLAQQLLLEAGPLLNMPSLADPHSILLKNTKIQNAQVTQPQTQNLHNRIFGGFLMRRAFELAFSNAYIFGGSRPIFIEVDEVSFSSPVDVGDLLVFNSCVLYTEEQADISNYFHDLSDKELSGGNNKLPLLHIEVEAWVTEPEKVSAKLSNLFSFTFAVSPKSSDKPQHKIRRVLPSNIDEARRIANRILSDKDQRNY